MFLFQALCMCPRTDVNIAGESGGTPLHYTCYNDNVDVTKVLVSHFAPVYALDKVLVSRIVSVHALAKVLVSHIAPVHALAKVQASRIGLYTH